MYQRCASSEPIANAVTRILGHMKQILYPHSCQKFNEKLSIAVSKPLDGWEGRERG